MIVEISIGNYLSFKDTVTISLVASNVKEHKETHIFQEKKLNLLKSAILYGANASGKTNLISALSFIRSFVLNSATNYQADEEISVNPFKLNTSTETMPSYFEIVFIQNQIRYRYGFETTQEKVISEWLFYVPKSREVELFNRQGNHYSIKNSFKEGKGLESKTRENALFLSVVAQFNGEISNDIIEWFKNLYAINGVNNGRLSSTKKWLKDDERKKKIIDFIKLADLSIDDLTLKPIDLDDQNLPEDIPNEIRDFIAKMDSDVLFSSHKKYDKNNNFVTYEPFHVDSTESEGTIKIISLAVPIIDALQKGKVLFIDELDAKLHPLITKTIINMFNSNDLNLKNAQLIFSTHDTSHLNKKYFRRDQIWFVEKDKYGCSDLYSLVEYSLGDLKVRNDASFDKEYINGKYGAIPFIGDLYSLLED